MPLSRAFVGIAALAITGCASTAGMEQSMGEDDALVFERFKKLAGTFLEVDAAGEPARIEYRLISRGEALTETWVMPPGEYGSNGKEELTVFHMDNGVLIATHYCATGVHPTMMLDPGGPQGVYNFIPRTISNLSSSDEIHNSAFSYTFVDENTVRRSEQWSGSGPNTTSYLTMVRSPD